MGLEKLYTDCAAQRAANAGKLPVLEYTGSKLEKIGKGTTRIPNFNIVSWIDKPAGMSQSDEEYVAQAVVAPAPAPKPVAAPAPAPVKTVMGFCLRCPCRGTALGMTPPIGRWLFWRCPSSWLFVLLAFICCHFLEEKKAEAVTPRRLLAFS